MTRGGLELATGEKIAGKYRIESVLGRGGMGAVYLATNEDLGRRVAIKVLLGELAFDDTLLKRFRQEARTAAAIGHPGIVDVLDLGTTEDGAPFIVMEALEGETLGGRLARGGLPPLADVLDIMEQALDALAAAHDKGILHRDLKPDNIFLVTKPVPIVKLLDFGISKLGDSAEDVSLTRTGMVFGTPLFMSPEQARGAKNAGPPSDVYAMGAIMYQMLTGRTPFTGASYNEVLSNLLTEPFEPLLRLRPDLPHTLLATVERMLARDASSRPQTARDARDALRALDLPKVDTSAPTAVRAAVSPVANGLAVTAPPTVAPNASTVVTGAGAAAAPAPTPVPVRAPARRGAPVVWLGVAIALAGGAAAVVLAIHGGASPVAPPPDARGSGSSAPAPIVTDRPPPPPDAAVVVPLPDAEPARTVAPLDAAVARPLAHDAGAVIVRPPAVDAALPATTVPPAGETSHELTPDRGFPGSPTP